MKLSLLAERRMKLVDDMQLAEDSAFRRTHKKRTEAPLRHARGQGSFRTRAPPEDVAFFCMNDLLRSIPLNPIPHCAK